MAALQSLLVRLAHVLGMAVLLGGVAFVWNGLRTSGGVAPSQLRQFEWAFWAALGVMVVTGVGNLGAVGAPGPSTRWGTLLTGKLLVVVVLVLGSFVRTLAVLRLRADDGTGVPEPLRRTYAATGWTLLVVVVLAEVLAHG